ncbi:hypothetical protein FACS1894207_1370 [Bacteroidia bacterium]|nr:hypothetical protein FACS1894207_1370 [Bacteroidia bacterium]
MKRFHFLGHVVMGLAIAAAFSVAVMLLWNWLAPAIFGWAVINFWQALGLLVLARILFGGLGHRHWLDRSRHHHNPIREKWMNMTNDERKEFMKKRHFGHHGCGHDFFQDDKSEKQE